MTSPLLLPVVLPASPGGFHLLVETLQAGGLIMVLIILCSVAALSISIITWMRMRERLLMPDGVVSQLRQLPTFAVRGDITPLHQYLEEDGSVLARLGLIAVSGQYPSKAECAEICAAKAREELHKLERDLPFLEVMVTIAPLLGLLGTTAGLVGMFSAFGQGDAGGPDTAAIAREIGVALRCTIAGLLVAVPSVVAHTMFVRKLDGISMKLETILQDTIQSFYQHFEVQRTINDN
ncbi:MAG: MotA/TolQ/ExbB proton channel [Verrucomicrobiaceae bacterium]|nr:MotA/TolQ/ExbB proton channel [Verrucomicrobiaceae bacterium]